MIRTFLTDTGITISAVTTEQMIEVDRVAVKETGPNLFQMMENAGRNLALQAIASLQGSCEGWQTANIVVLAGSGGNGGGGICAARHLANRGMNVRLCLSSPDRLKEVSQWQHHIFQSTPGQEISPSESTLRPETI